MMAELFTSICASNFDIYLTELLANAFFSPWALVLKTESDFDKKKRWDKRIWRWWIWGHLWREESTGKRWGWLLQLWSWSWWSLSWWCSGAPFSCCCWWFCWWWWWWRLSTGGKLEHRGRTWHQRYRLAKRKQGST